MEFLSKYHEKICPEISWLFRTSHCFSYERVFSSKLEFKEKGIKKNEKHYSNFINIAFSSILTKLLANS